jgi:hypothetical protein
MSGEILDQMCSGRMGTQWRIMSGFGLEHSNTTVVSSTAVAFSMRLVYAVKFAISLSTT